MKRFLNILLTFLFLLMVMNMSGCSDGRLKTEHVSGIITLDGVPLADATVGFGPKVAGQGAVGFARTNEKGEYILQAMNGRPDAGTLPGEYAVTVAKYKLVPTGRKETDPYTRKVTDEMTSVFLFPEMKTYADAETTPFSATVVKGKNTFDFDIKSKP